MERALCPVLIGRESEVTTLEDALLAAKRGDGQIVLLAGEAGLGKTRLAGELQRRALKLGTTALWGGCSEADLALPYLPFLEAIGNFLVPSRIESVREQLGPIRVELASLFPQLEPGGGGRDAGDATQAKLRLFEGVMALLRIAAGDNGLLLVLEDLHWSDTSTRELLEYLTRRVSGMRVMVLGTYRSDELHRKHPLAPVIQGWRRSKAVEVIQLDPLPLPGVTGMVGAIFELDEVTPEFAEFLYGRSEGNPFVLEELLKSALDRGDIYRSAERWERKALSELRLPQTVRDTILLRVERLSAEQADILQTAAVLGRSWNYRSLVALSGRDEVTVQAALHASIQQQLLEEDPGERGRYRFRHALTREAIYDDIIAPQREQLHARAAAMLANLPGTRPVDLAFHLFAASRWTEAIPVGIKAAEDAERSRAYRDAAELYERLLAHVNDDLTRGQVLCRLGHAHYQSVDPGRAQRFLEQGIPLLERAGQRREAAHYRLILGRCFWERAQPDVARSIYEEARREMEADGPSEDLATAYVRLAGLEMFNARYEACLKLASRAVEVAEEAGAEDGAIWGRVFVGSALCGLGRADEGLAIVDESHQQAIARGNWWVARNALHNGITRRILGLRVKEAEARLPLYDQLPPAFFKPFDQAGVWLYLGYPAKALPFFEQALTQATDSESLTGANWIRREIASTMSALGRHQEAIAQLPSLESQREMQDVRATVQRRIEVFHDAGEVTRAASEAARLLERDDWGSLNDRRVLFDAAIEALIATGQTEAAARLVHATRTEPADDDPYQARMEGRLALALGQINEARVQAEAAIRRFEEVEQGLDVMESRRLLAETAFAAGDRDAAVRELQGVLERATKREAVAQREAAAKRLAELGVDRTSPVAARGGEPVELSERLVTVLFLDIRGYTTLSASEAPERVADSLANLYRWSRLEIERHHGLVDKYEGDAVMATFNVAGARLDHAVLALRAAIAIRDKAAAAQLPVGAAIAVGPAIVGKLTVDSPLSSYGEVTNLASRLQGQANAGEILLTEEAYRRVRGWLDERALKAAPLTISVKGYPDPVAVFRLGLEISHVAAHPRNVP